MKNLNDAYKEAKKKGHAFYNLQHEYQPGLNEIKKMELIEEQEWFDSPTEREFRQELASFVLRNAELLSKDCCYLGIHHKPAKIDLFSFSIDEEVTTLDQFLYNIDYEQLREQKLEIIRSNMHDGILNLIDAIQDLACLRGIKPEKDIFLKGDE